MATDVYKKIEKKITDLKNREEVWKTRYRESAQQLKEMADFNSQQIKGMDKTIGAFEARLNEIERVVKKNDEKTMDTFRLAEKRLSDILEKTKSLSLKMDERASEIRGLKSEVTSQVNSIIAKHEKTFGDVIEKINLAVRMIENETVKESNISDKVEAAKRFLENYRPPDPPPDQVPQPAKFTARAPAPGIPIPQPPLADNPPRGMDFRNQEPPFVYNPLEPSSAPARRIPRRPVFLDDDDLDMDDINPMASQGADFTNSVTAMNTHVSTIADKLASIEEKVARIQSDRSSGSDRIEDKIKMYSQSVADMQNRMETVEKALRDGMTPMVESLNILTQTVKSLKEESRPSLAKPSPPSAIQPKVKKR